MPCCLLLLFSRRQFRFAILTFSVAVVLVLLAIRITAFAGLLRVHRIATGSMAPTLLGAHYQTNCSDCGFDVAWDVGQQPEDDVIVCPNCSKQQVVASPKQIAGQRVVIDRWPYWFDSPKRWDAIAFRVELDEPIEVKRILGLPGEAIELLEGDLWIDGKIAQKSFHQFRESAILIHDNAFQPKSDLPARWYGVSPGEQPFTLRAGGRAVPRFRSWLPVREATPPIERTQEHPIVDVNCYNQTESRSRFFACRDLMMEFVIKAKPYTTLTVEFKRFGVSITLDVRKRSVIAKMPNKTSFKPINRGPFQISIALCDLQVFVAVNNNVLLAEDVSQRVERAKYKEEQLPRILIDRPTTISKLKLYRDIYLLGPYGDQRWKSAAADGYFVIGDNVSGSQDSRFGHRVSRESILGKTKKW